MNQILAALLSGTQDAAVTLILADTAGIVAIPIVGQVWSGLVRYFVGSLSSYFYAQAAAAATSIIVDMQVNEEESAATNAFQNLQMAIASGDKDVIKKASDDLDKAYASLIHYDGSASP